MGSEIRCQSMLRMSERKPFHVSQSGGVDAVTRILSLPTSCTVNWL